MGTFLDWSAFEAVPKAIERSPVRRWPYPVRIAVAIPILVAVVIVFALFALIVAVPRFLP